MIRHTAFFRLRHPESSPEEHDFLEAGRALAGIPGVQRFEVLREVSPKNHYRFGFAMEFADADAYEAYNQHPVHTAFVAERWVREVEDFQEIDTVPYESSIAL